ncbi:uncharacterized protein LOC135844395 [Planococcus citri]|uniref:uncharacterized protein LOC135844395 n=1 Tax=Planococcus citri TaxID=170843 RepID=UPI0031F8225F
MDNLTEEQKRKRRPLSRDVKKLLIEADDLVNKSTLNLEQINLLETIAADLRIRLEMLNDYDDEITLALTDDTKSVALETALETEKKLYAPKLRSMEAKCKAQRSKLAGDISRNSIPGSPNESMHAPACTPKLAKISPPTFDGNILNFQNYRGLFENLVHNQSDLSNVQKLYYLKQSCIGDAKDLLRDFELEDELYVEAWNYMLSKFDNRRLVIRILFKKLIGVEPIKTASQIRQLTDEIDIVMRGLKANKLECDGAFSRFVCFLVSTKLDNRTAVDWENSISSNKEFPTYKEIEKFLRNRAFVADERQVESQQSKSKGDKTKSERKTTATATLSKKPVPPSVRCVVCNNNHFLNDCSTFLSKTPQERHKIVKSSELCRLCFNPHHHVTNCKRSKCKTCGASHHSLLHFNTTSSNEDNAKSNDTETKPEPKSTLTAHTGDTKPTSPISSNKTVFLSTAVVNVKSADGKVIPARILLDQGSETCLITRDICNRAKLPVLKNDNPITLIGINDTTKTLQHKTKFVLESRFSKFQMSIEADIVKKIPYSISRQNVGKILGKFSKLKFAESNELPYSSVDIILGAEYVEFVLGDQRHFYEGICLRDTHFGFIISGSQKSSFLSTAYCGLTNVDIEQQLKRFCQIEDIFESNPKEAEKPAEHVEIEKHFESTYQRDSTGRFVLRLPVKPSINVLNGSFNKAKVMLLKNEKKSSAVREAYCKFMNEYENLNHMKKIESFDVNSYYIPHHMVVKNTPTDTKYRVVFNASCNDKSGTSLNDHLLSGPTLQPELFDNVISFRQFIIAYCADIKHMYRQILIHADDRKFQRILWRYGLSDPISLFELMTLTYGTGPAAYMATKCLQVIARDIEHEFPIIAKIIRKGFYMDNLMTGAKNVEAAREILNSIHSTLESYGFPLCKYQSNSAELLENIDSSLIEPLNSRVLGNDPSIYVLGLVWSPQSDTLNVMINLTPLPDSITKRVMLSDISRIFDILGILTPLTIRAKLLMQALWKQPIGWDDVVPSDIIQEYLSYRNDLSILSKFSIPRPYSLFEDVKIYHLIGFCDASTKAYCAVIYLRSISVNGNITVTFVCAKSRVAPVKPPNIHRLELLAAVILSQLISRVCSNLKIDVENVYNFSDSKTVLNWINHPVEKLKQFVSNRVAKILLNTLKENWFYVDTKSNPADLATRGISAQNLIENSLWTSGPAWINDDFEEYISLDSRSFKYASEEVLETCKVKCSFNVTRMELVSSFLNYYSSFVKCINVLSYIFRFILNIKNRIQRKNYTNVNDDSTDSEKGNVIDESEITIENDKLLSVTERNVTFKKILHEAQMEHFSKEYNVLLYNKLNQKSIELKEKPLKFISKKSSLYSLNVILDEDNLIRVGGRLSTSNFSYEFKHPIVLSRYSRFLELFVVHIHEKYFHASKSFVVNFIRSRYWIIGGLTYLVKKAIISCVRCVEIGSSVVQQFMADLPKERVSISRPFSTTGVDLSGFFQVKCVNHRSVKHYKVYIAFFVCFTTRAVHLELVDNLSTEAFVAAFERFIARRGLPSTMYSDNATNFVGFRNVIQHDKLMDWKFIAPRTPHQGGLWEAAVKSGKAYLLKAIGSQVLSYSELNTVVIKVESILNSRPISYLANNNDIEPLTPAHFLIGSCPFDTPSSDDLLVKCGIRYRLWRSIIDSFWTSWRRSYLTYLQARTKWKKKLPNMKVGDVVIIKSPNEAVLSWPLGRIIETFPDSSNIVRNVMVRSKDGVFRRSVQQLVLLPVNSDQI